MDQVKSIFEKGSSFCWILVIMLSFLFSTNGALGQDSQISLTGTKGQANKPNTDLLNTAVKEEVQRYMGYEILPARYLSLPYDTSQNTNIQSAFVDITCLIFLFCPIFFLLAYRDKPLKGICFMLLSLFFLTVSVPNSFVNTTDSKTHLTTATEIDNYIATTSFSEAPTHVITAHIWQFFDYLYTPIKALFTSVSGEKDHITYPLLILLFIGGFFMLQDRIKAHTIKRKALINFVYLFSFFWLMLTAGIIWYGYLMIAFGVLMSIYPLQKMWKSTDLLDKLITRGGSGIILLWVFMMLVARMAGYQKADTTAKSKTLLLDYAVAEYQSGRYNYKQTMESFFPNAQAALAKINSEEESLIYKVGTVLPYFIKKTDRRVFEDNQLGGFQNYYNQLQDPVGLAKAFKAANYKYILVDINTPYIDKTPEKTLTKKFNNLLSFLFQNPQLELLATNRVMEVERNGRKERANTLWGKRVLQNGSYAIYEIK